MVREISMIEDGFREKVLVCITAQSNSKRLINRGAQVASECNGELHILHIQKGDNIFNNEETLALLQRLYLYGSEKGGMVHAFCDDEVALSIGKFAKEEKITKLVMGELPQKFTEKMNKNRKHNQFQKILESLPLGIQIIIVKREEENSTELEEKRMVV